MVSMNVFFLHVQFWHHTHHAETIPQGSDADHDGRLPVCLHRTAGLLPDLASGEKSLPSVYLQPFRLVLLVLIISVSDENEVQD